MDKPNLMESVQPGSGQYSWKIDLRLNAWLGVATAVYLAGLALLHLHPEWAPFPRGLLALAPIIPGLLYVRSWMRFIRGLDELQRRLQLEAFLFAALGTVGLGTAVNILNAQGVQCEWLKHGLGLGDTFMLMLVLWPVGWCIAQGRYK